MLALVVAFFVVDLSDFDISTADAVIDAPVYLILLPVLHSPKDETLLTFLTTQIANAFIEYFTGFQWTQSWWLL